VTYTGFWKRFLAALLDGLLLGVVYVVVRAITGDVGGIVHVVVHAIIGDVSGVVGAVIG
jgi:hypothetical protein